MKANSKDLQLNPEEFLEITERSIRQLYEKDKDLIDLNVNERSVAHRLALYLENAFEDKKIDCEYNRYGEDKLIPKQLEGIEGCLERKTTDWIIPDIVIHERRSRDRNNLAVFEIKCKDHLDSCDVQKLVGMTKESGNFKYTYGMGLEFYSNSCNIFVFINGTKQERLTKVVDLTQI